MDPFKALQDLDKVVQEALVNRDTHAHFIRCIAAISEALVKAKPSV